MEERKIKVGITHGDINGIGYEVILKALHAGYLWISQSGCISS